MPPAAARPAAAAAAANDDEVGVAMRELGLKPAGVCARCGVNASMVGVTCRHCNERFCTAHALPEVHGCGEDAKVAARGAWLKEHRDPLPKPPSATEQKVSKQKLSAKLEAAAAARRGGSGRGGGKGGAGGAAGRGRT